MNVGLIGAGYAGKKRIENFPRGVRLHTICDVNKKVGERLAKQFGSHFESNWKKVVSNPAISAVIVATTNNLLVPMTLEAIKNGKHVLCEKPGGLTSKEIQKVFDSNKKTRRVIQYGYTLKYHKSIRMAQKIVNSGKFGKVLFVRGIYGHGGRVGYEKEWRFDKRLSGGGELMDQGCHLLDLVQLFCGSMTEEKASMQNLFWRSELEDTAFMVFQNKSQMAQLSVSCVEWKNIFSFEIMLERAKIHIQGLGGSYGPESLTLYKMRKKMGPPTVKVWNFESNSWQAQNDEFFRRIKQGKSSNDEILQALSVMRTIEKLYRNVSS